MGIEKFWWRIVRFGFRLLYNELAWTYDLVSWAVSMGHWHQWQQSSIPYLTVNPDDLVLELAHGTGELQVDMARADINSIGLDLSSFMGRIAQRKLKRRGLEIPLVRADAQAIPFPDESFEAVVSTFPTEFIITSKTLAEIWRILKPGGRVVIVPNGLLTGKGIIATFLEQLYRITGQRNPWPFDPVERLTRAGFRAQLEVHELPDSQVWIVVGVKPE